MFSFACFKTFYLFWMLFIHIVVFYDLNRELLITFSRGKNIEEIRLT